MLFSLIIWWFATKECQECASPRALLLSSPSLVLLNWPLLYYCCIPWQIETTTILVTLIGRVALTIHWWRLSLRTSALFKKTFCIWCWKMRRNNFWQDHIGSARKNNLISICSVFLRDADRSAKSVHFLMDHPVSYNFNLSTFLISQFDFEPLSLLSLRFSNF